MPQGGFPAAAGRTTRFCRQHICAVCALRGERGQMYARAVPARGGVADDALRRFPLESRKSRRNFSARRARRRLPKSHGKFSFRPKLNFREGLLLYPQFTAQNLEHSRELTAFPALFGTAVAKVYFVFAHDARGARREHDDLVGERYRLGYVVRD